MPLQPDEIDTLRRVLTKVCETRGAPLDSAEAENLAFRLINIFQSGVHTESALIAEISTEEP